MAGKRTAIMDEVTSSAHETSTGEASDGRADPPTPTVDVVIVSYNSARYLRRCVEPLSKLPRVRVIVIDNASADDSLAAVAT